MESVLNGEMYHFRRCAYIFVDYKRLHTGRDLLVRSGGFASRLIVEVRRKWTKWPGCGAGGHAASL